MTYNLLIKKTGQKDTARLVQTRQEQNYGEDHRTWGRPRRSNPGHQALAGTALLQITGR